jgi:hypothetical protein
MESGKIILPGHAIVGGQLWPGFESLGAMR